MHVNNSSVHFCCCYKSKENIVAKRRWNMGTKTCHDVSTEMCLSVFFFLNDCDTNAEDFSLLSVSIVFLSFLFFFFLLFPMKTSLSKSSSLFSISGPCFFYVFFVLYHLFFLISSHLLSLFFFSLPHSLFLFSCALFIL